MKRNDTITRHEIAGKACELLVREHIKRSSLEMGVFR